MNMTYQIELTPELINHFESVLSSECLQSEANIIKKTRKALIEIKQNNSRSFVDEHTDTLEEMVSMLVDKRWNMEQVDKEHVLKAMNYLARDNDIIPDNIPGLGLLDDCIIIDIVADKVKHELEAYRDYKKAESVYGRDKVFLVSDWLDIKRKELFSRMRSRRNKAQRTRSSRIIF